MSAVGSGYDQSASTISPDGRVFQVEYASKAVDNKGTVIGLRCQDGVVLAAEKIVASPLLVPGKIHQLFSIDKNIGVAVGGWVTDGRQLVQYARQEVADLRKQISRSEPISKMLVDRMGSYMHAYTLYSVVRPFGSNMMVASYDSSGPSLYMIETSGNYNGYYGCAVGKGKEAAKTEIEKLNLQKMSCREAVLEAAKIIHTVHDDEKDKIFELELGWVGEITGGVYQTVPDKIAKEAEQFAKSALAEDSDSDHETP